MQFVPRQRVWGLRREVADAFRRCSASRKLGMESKVVTRDKSEFEIVSLSFRISSLILNGDSTRDF